MSSHESARSAARGGLEAIGLLLIAAQAVQASMLRWCPPKSPMASRSHYLLNELIWRMENGSKRLCRSRAGNNLASELALAIDHSGS